MKNIVVLILITMLLASLLAFSACSNGGVYTVDKTAWEAALSDEAILAETKMSYQYRFTDSNGEEAQISRHFNDNYQWSKTTSNPQGNITYYDMVSGYEYNYYVYEGINYEKKSLKKFDRVCTPSASIVPDIVRFFAAEFKDNYDTAIYDDGLNAYKYKFEKETLSSADVIGHARKYRIYDCIIKFKDGKFVGLEYVESTEEKFYDSLGNLSRTETEDAIASVSVEIGKTEEFSIPETSVIYKIDDNEAQNELNMLSMAFDDPRNNMFNDMEFVYKENGTTYTYNNSKRLKIEYADGIIVYFNFRDPNADGGKTVYIVKDGNVSTYSNSEIPAEYKDITVSQLFSKVVWMCELLENEFNNDYYNVNKKAYTFTANYGRGEFEVYFVNLSLSKVVFNYLGKQGEFYWNYDTSREIEQIIFPTAQ